MNVATWLHVYMTEGKAGIKTFHLPPLDTPFWPGDFGVIGRHRPTEQDGYNGGGRSLLLVYFAVEFLQKIAVPKISLILANCQYK